MPPTAISAYTPASLKKRATSPAPKLLRGGFRSPTIAWRRRAGERWTATWITWKRSFKPCGRSELFFMPVYSAIQSTLHVGIIMDGNGRWALARGLPRAAGHRAGVETVRRVVEAAAGCGISILTLFAFSSDNWRRPADEVDTLMRLLAAYLETETARCVADGVRVEAIGRRDRLTSSLQLAIARAE